MATGAVKLPPGFVLDTQPQGQQVSNVKLPPGFVLDNAPVSITPQRESFGKTALRGTLNIPLSTVKLPVNLIKGAANLLVGLIPYTKQNKALTQMIMSAPDKVAEQVANLYVKPGETLEKGLQSFADAATNDPAGTMFNIGATLTGVGGVVGTGTKIGKILTGAGEVGLSGATAIPKTIGAVPSLVKPAMRPFAKQYMPEVAQAAERLGVPVTASTVSKAPAVSTIETIGAKGLFGGKLAAKAEETGIKLKQVAEDMIAQTDRIPDKALAGRKILDSARNYQRGYFSLRSKLYDEARIPVTELKYTPAPGTAGRINFAEMKTDISRKNAIPVNTNDTLKYVDELLKEERLAQRGSSNVTPLYKELTDVKRSLAPRYNKQGGVIGIPAREIEAKVRRYAERANFSDPIVTGDPAKWRSISKKLDGDLDVALKEQRPDLHEAKSRADAYYQEGLHTLQNKTIEKIYELKDQPDLIVDTIIKPAMSEEDLTKVFQVIGKEQLPQIQAITLKNIFDKSTSGTTNKFTPAALDKNIQAYGTKLKKILTTEQYNKLQDLNTVVRGYARGQKVAAGSQTAFIARIAGELGISGFNPLVAMKLILGDAAFTSLVSSKYGQKYLTTGFGKTKIEGFKNTLPPLKLKQ